MITIKIADIPIALDARYDYTVDYVKEFICDDEPEFTVSATDDVESKLNHYGGFA